MSYFHTNDLPSAGNNSLSTPHCAANAAAPIRNARESVIAPPPPANHHQTPHCGGPAADAAAVKANA